jgi:hypothetical protein
MIRPDDEAAATASRKWRKCIGIDSVGFDLHLPVWLCP